jgi:hypothetical protein
MAAITIEAVTASPACAASTRLASRSKRLIGDTKEGSAKTAGFYSILESLTMPCLWPTQNAWPPNLRWRDILMAAMLSRRINQINKEEPKWANSSNSKLPTVIHLLPI